MTLWFTAIGEPPICLGVSALTAIRDAINSCRDDLGIQGWWQLGELFSFLY